MRFLFTENLVTRSLLTDNSETPVRLLTKDVEWDDVDEEDVSAPGGDHVEVGQGAEGRPVDVPRLHRLSFPEFKQKIDFLFLKRTKLNLKILLYRTYPYTDL